MLLLVPLFAFVGTVIAVLRTDNDQTDTLLQQAAVNGWVYVLLYIISGLAFGVCLWLVGRGMRGLA